MDYLEGSDEHLFFFGLKNLTENFLTPTSKYHLRFVSSLRVLVIHQYIKITEHICSFNKFVVTSILSTALFTLIPQMLFSKF